MTRLFLKYSVLLFLAGAFLLPSNFVFASPLETVVSTYFDAATIVKGYTVESHDQVMRLGIRPDTLNVSTQVDMKTLSPELMEGTYPEGMELIGNVYLFDILNKSSYDGTDFFFLEIKYPEEDTRKVMHGKRRIYFFNGVTGEWGELPSEDNVNTQSVRALIHLPYARLAIFEETIPEIGYASWYAYKDCDCAASPDYPKGTYLVVTRLSDPTQQITVRVNDYGPDRSIFPERIIDLDKTAFEKIAPLGAGVSKVSVKLLQ